MGTTNTASWCLLLMTNQCCFFKNQRYFDAKCFKQIKACRHELSVIFLSSPTSSQLQMINCLNKLAAHVVTVFNNIRRVPCFTACVFWNLRMCFWNKPIACYGASFTTVSLNHVKIIRQLAVLPQRHKSLMHKRICYGKRSGVKTFSF